MTAKKRFTIALSLLLCVCMLIPTVTAYTWQTPSTRSTSNGSTYSLDLSGSISYPAKSGVTVTVNGSYTRFTATGADPWVQLPVPSCTSNQMKYIVVVYKTAVTGSQAKLGFYTAYSGVGLSENANSLVKRSYEASGKWDAMIFDMTGTTGSHKYTTLRMDMLDNSTAGQYVDIKTIIAFPTYEQAVAYEARHDNWDMMKDNYTLDFGAGVTLTSANQLSTQLVEGKFTRMTATGSDPYATLPRPDAKSTDMDFAVILYRTKVSGASGEFYFQYKNTAGSVVNMGQSRSQVGFKYGDTSGEWATQIVDMTSISSNCGSNVYMNFRFDPLTSKGTIDVASITCFGTRAEATAYASSLEGFSTLVPNYAVDMADDDITLRQETNMSHRFVNDQYIRMTSSTGDPHILLTTPMCDTKDMRYVVMVYRINSASQGEIYVSRSDGTGMSQATRVGWTWSDTSGNWATKTVDLNSIAKSGTTYTNFRLDPLTVAGKTIDLRYIAGFATAEDAAAFAALYKGYTTEAPSYEADLSTDISFSQQNQVNVLKVSDRYTRFTATGGDPFVALPTPDSLCIHSRYAVVVYRTNVAGSSAEMFVSRSDGTGWTGANLSWKWKNTTGEWDSMVIDVSSIMSTDVNTTLTSLRIDPLTATTASSGKWVDLRSVALFETREAAELYAASFDGFRTTYPNLVLDGCDTSGSSQISSVNNMTATFSSDGMHIQATTSDPYFHLPDPNMAGELIRYLTIFYKLPSGGNGEVYTLYDGAYHQKGFSWPATSGDGWGKLVLDISSITTGATPSVLRLDPLTSTGSIDIRMIGAFATYEDAAGFELSDYVWSETAYEEKQSTTLDSDPGTLKYTYNSNNTVTISYKVNGTGYSYTVPNSYNYLHGALAGTDDLGRSLPTALDVGVYGENGQHEVGLFYFLWMGLHGDYGVYDLQDILDTYGKEGAKDLSHYGGYGVMHWFSEPLYGYYYSNDTWVLRKHIEQLTNANVDFLYLDITNGIDMNYINGIKRVMSVCAEYRNMGYDAPQVVCYTNTAAEGVVQAIYDFIYKQNYCPEAWYRINGKPVIVAPNSANINNFFTIKQNQWPNDSTYKANGWPWMDFQWPQRVFTTNAVNEASAISVSIAQHSGNTIFSSSSIYDYSSSNGNRGRSYDGSMSVAATVQAVNNNPDLTKYGLNFQAQWDRAIAANVPYVLVTGWNEWVAQLQPKSLTGYDVGFVDTASEEYSRDAEMLRGGYFDNYYMQLAANITKLKGAAPIVVQDARYPINVTGSFTQWNQVQVSYNDPSGDMQNRHGQAFGNTYQNDTTGRNDIVNAKVTSDSEYVYFYVETAGNISMYDNDSSWMQLFVNTDRDAENGWYGYDYIINYNAKSQNTTTVAKCTAVDGSFKFTEIGEVRYQVKGHEMMIAVPQSMLGITGYKEIYLEFKWADADVQIDEMEDFYCYGDAAPAGRMNFIYQNYIPGVSQITYETATTGAQAATVSLSTAAQSAAQSAGIFTAPIEVDVRTASLLTGQISLQVASEESLGLTRTTA